MSVRFLSDVFKQARTLLNDDDAVNWPDYRLHTKAIVAFEELEAELIIAGIPIINSVSAIINVPPVTVDDSNLNLSTVVGFPTDIIIPIWMKERQIGNRNQDFVDMTEVDFIPNIDLDISLHYWCWYQNTIMLRGALNSVQVQLRYQRYLSIPDVNTDSLVIPLGQLFIANRVAALAYQSTGNRQMWLDLTTMANTNLIRIIDMNIKEMQDMPAKRRPYHRGYGRNKVLRDF
jgi:hypothetical protein